MTVETLRLTLTLLGVLLLPGWAILAATGLWRHWSPLQRWGMAFSLSIAFLPVLFYLSRWLFPGLALGPNKLLALLIAAGLVTLFYLRRDGAAQFQFDTWDWFTIAALGAALITRFWLIQDYPYPAWSDSLHHTLLTQLVMENGQLPLSLEPFEPVSLVMYHLGLYAITGAFGMLADIPPHTALLYISQVLNGLCGVGVYLALSQWVSKRAALVGVVVVGLLSFQPAWYVNWGRFTQLASQAILLSAWVFTHLALERIFAEKRLRWDLLTPWLVGAALLNAAVFLLHFRVAGYYLPLLAFSTLYLGWRAYQMSRLRVYLVSLTALGGVSLALVLPVLLPALSRYLNRAAQTAQSAPTGTGGEYFSYTFDTIFLIGLQPWLFYAAAAGLLLWLVRRTWVSAAVVFWIVLLVVEGNLYRLAIPGAGFTNFTAIMIMFYLPAALVVGAGVDSLMGWLPARQRPNYDRLLLTACLMAGFVGSFHRATAVEPARHFVTQADLAAMEWIKAYTPEDALFAINTYMWLGSAPHGTDGGYWIPYFTGRRTNTGTMMATSGTPTYVDEIIKTSKLVNYYANEIVPIELLCDYGVDYIYSSGDRDYFYNDLYHFLQSDNYQGEVVYDTDRLLIISICK